MGEMFRLGIGVIHFVKSSPGMAQLWIAVIIDTTNRALLLCSGFHHILLVE